MLILILIDVQYLQNTGFSFEKTKTSIGMKMICQSLSWMLFVISMTVVAALLNKYIYLILLIGRVYIP